VSLTVLGKNLNQKNRIIDTGESFGPWAFLQCMQGFSMNYALNKVVSFILDWL
jgi:hypothetical protein